MPYVIVTYGKVNQQIKPFRASLSFSNNKHIHPVSFHFSSFPSRTHTFNYHTFVDCSSTRLSHSFFRLNSSIVHHGEQRSQYEWQHQQWWNCPDRHHHPWLGLVLGTFALNLRCSSGADEPKAVTAVMVVSTMVFMGLSFTKPRTHRVFHYITAAITLVASIAYFTMGSNLGWTPIQVEFVRSNPRVGGLTGGNREIFYVRYIDWYDHDISIH